jgi:hypothetical protein
VVGRYFVNLTPKLWQRDKAKDSPQNGDKRSMKVMDGYHEVSHVISMIGHQLCLLGIGHFTRSALDLAGDLLLSIA